MSEFSELLVALTGASTVAGGGIIWLWNKVERNTAKAKKLIDAKLDKIDEKLRACEEREIEGQSRRVKQLHLIDMLFQEVKRLTAGKTTPVLTRAKVLLKELQDHDHDDG